MSLWLIIVLLLRSCLSFETGRPRIAVDYGPRLIGLACSDIFGAVNPLCTLSNNGDLVHLAREVLQYARREGATEAIVGLPTDNNGKMSYDVRNFNGNLCLNFATVLSSVASEEMKKLRVLLFDERYTTREAKAKMKDEKIRASLDAVAAACLLQRYMEDQGEGALEARLCLYPPPDDLAYFDYSEVKSYIQDIHYYNSGSQGRKNLRRMQALKEGKFRGFPKIYREKDSTLSASDAVTQDNASNAFSEDMNENEGIEYDFTGHYGGLDDTLASFDGNAFPCGHGFQNGEIQTETEEGIMEAEIEEEIEEELLGLMRIRAARRRKGTLKRLHNNRN